MDDQQLTSSPYMSIIVGVVGGCSLDCIYCFKGFADFAKPLMDEETVENTIRKIMGIPWLRGVNFLWQGGEPLEQNLDFYKQALYLEKINMRNDVNIRNSLQTNGTLLTDEALEFFVENDFGLGISLDGPKDIHDAQRVYRKTQKGTYEDTLRAIAKLRALDRRIGLIAVVTRLGIDRPLELFDFLTELADSVKFRPMLNWGSGVKNKDNYGITPGEYTNFLEEIFPRWLECPSDKKVSPFQEFYYGLSSKSPITCSSNRCHENYLYIAPSGDVYLCSEFEGNPRFCYGNINEDPIEKILSSPNRQRIFEERSQIQGCTQCEFYEFCNSGCPVSTYMVNERLDHRDYWCSVYQQLFEMTRKVQSASIHFIEQIKDDVVDNRIEPSLEGK